MRKVVPLALVLWVALAAPGARADSCSAVPVADVDQDGTPFGTTQCADVRPGVAVSTPIGGCSLNFVFSGSDGNRYIGTAGHCIAGSGTWDRVYESPGPEARVGGRRIGEFAYAVLGNNRDFALIRIDPDVAVDPRMAHFGGPTGIYTDHSAEPIIVHHYGKGIGYGATVPARTGIARDTVAVHAVRSYSAAIFGDSGGPMIDAQGRAVGVNVQLGGSGGTLVSTRIDWQLPLAEEFLGITLTLETAPLA